LDAEISRPNAGHSRLARRWRVGGVPGLNVFALFSCPEAHDVCSNHFNIVLFRSRGQRVGIEALFAHGRSPLFLAERVNGLGNSVRCLLRIAASVFLRSRLIARHQGVNCFARPCAGASEQQVEGARRSRRERQGHLPKDRLALRSRYALHAAGGVQRRGR
jgi:hypothetical protein